MLAKMLVGEPPQTLVVAKSALFRFRLATKTAHAPLLLLSPRNPLRWVCAGPHWLRPGADAPGLNFGTKWCAPRQVDSEIIYILRMKILPAYHMVLGAMQPVDGHGLP